MCPNIQGASLLKAQYSSLDFITFTIEYNPSAVFDPTLTTENAAILFGEKESEENKQTPIITERN